MASIFHSRTIPSLETCTASFHHDGTAQFLSCCIVLGLIISYLPQHYRIIHNKSSEGFSPYFLMLGATGSASSFMNIITLQWGQVECCKYLTAGQCFESTLGITQVFFQWAMFNIIFILYLIFYPRSSKFVRTLPLEHNSIPPLILSTPFTSFLPTFLRRPSFNIQSSTSSSNFNDNDNEHVFTSTSSAGNNNRTRQHRSSSRTSSTSSSTSTFDPSTILLPGELRHTSIELSPNYRLSLSLFCITILHLFLTTIVTFILLITLPTSPPLESISIFMMSIVVVGTKEHPSERAVRIWATFLGIAGVVLGCCQYAPQLLLTARRKLVGSLSIPMMFLQVPGSFVFVYTLAVRPGVNWTGWGTYLVTGILQGGLLFLCLSFKVRQKKLGIDDWGHLIHDIDNDNNNGEGGEERVVDERSRLL